MNLRSFQKPDEEGLISTDYIIVTIIGAPLSIIALLICLPVMIVAVIFGRVKLTEDDYW